MILPSQKLTQERFVIFIRWKAQISILTPTPKLLEFKYFGKIFIFEVPGGPWTISGKHQNFNFVDVFGPQNDEKCARVCLPEIYLWNIWSYRNQIHQEWLVVRIRDLAKVGINISKIDSRTSCHIYLLEGPNQHFNPYPKILEFKYLLLTENFCHHLVRMELVTVD